jgi:single-strand DNA-binding protein
MSGAVNKVILVGRLGRDPETRRTGDGSPVVIFSLATDESWRDKNTGARRQRTEWHNVVIYNEPLGKIADEYLRKGHRCYIEGMLATRTYTDKDGVERKVTEVLLKPFRGELVLLESSKRDAPSESDYGREQTRERRSRDHSIAHDDPRQAMSAPAAAQRPAPIDDDIPF